MTRTLLALLICTGFLPAQAAEGWKPTRIVNILVPAGPGSGNDVALAPVQKALDARGVKYVVMHMAGADGIVAVNHFKATAKPDGYSLLVYGLAHYAAADVFRKDVKRFAYDDFEPVSLLAKTPVAILAKYGDGTTVPDVIARLKANGTPIGSASMVHRLAWESLARDAGVPLTHLTFVSYPAPPPESMDIMRGDLVLGTAPLSTVASLYKDKKLGIVAITSPKRLPGLSDVPTVSETIPGYEVELDWGIVAAKGTPSDAIRFYADLIRQAMLGEDTQSYFAVNSLHISGAELGPDAYRLHIRQMRARLLGVAP